jgi:trans-4-hydroxy-L-proline dehydratase
LALHNGVAPLTGKRIGLETGDPRQFKTFEEMVDAYKKQVEFILKRLSWHCRFYVKTLGQRYRLPFYSSVQPGCVENGKDLMIGGQGDAPVWYSKDRAIINAADSLTAIKKLVFDEKNLTMDELLNALDSNFEGKRGEEIRHMCLSAPKYGNEVHEADIMVRDIGKFSAAVIHSEHNPFTKQPYAINRNGVGWHYYGGLGVGALPDGRKAREPLANGSLSPMQGFDRSGPTAVLNSALTADFKEAATGILNLRFPRSIIGSPDSMEKLASLTETFQRHGGTHVQYNLLDHEQLLKAKKNPEKYKDLVVRVAGYSTYFVALSPEIQDEIIQRTQHGL